MRGCLFTLLLGAALLGLGVFVGLPAVAAGMLTAALTAAGFQATDTTVTVTSDPPTDLIGLHADRVRVRATHATFRGLEMGSVDVTFRDVAILGRTAGSVDGSLKDVTMPDVGGHALHLAGLTLAGGGDAVTVSTTVSGPEAQALVSDAIGAQLGTRPTAVTFTAPDGVAVRMGGVVHARLAVSSGGDLVARISDGPEAGRAVVLLRSGADLPIRLTSVRVASDGSVSLAGALAVELLSLPGG